MKFEVYCDESRPDLLCSQHSTAQYMVIGGLWLPSKNRDQMKADIHALRNKYRMGGEFKSVYQENSPEKIYFLMLYNIFNEFLEDLNEDVLPNDLTGYKNSIVWNKLCSGLMEPDTLIRDNNNQLLRCQNGTETNIQTIF